MSGSLLSRLETILTGKRCVLCGQNTPEPDICVACDEDLLRIHCACRRCAMPLSSPADAELGCGRCQRRPPLFEFVIAPMQYAFPVSGMLKALKFRRQQFFAPALGRFLTLALDGNLDEVDAILPVPLHPRRNFHRGFNQALEIARPLIRQTGLPVIRNVRRRIATPPQSGLSTAKRQANLRAAFAVKGALGCRYPLIIDDVITTG